MPPKRKKPLASVSGLLQTTLDFAKRPPLAPLGTNTITTPLPAAASVVTTTTPLLATSINTTTPAAPPPQLDNYEDIENEDDDDPGAPAPAVTPTPGPAKKKKKVLFVKKSQKSNAIPEDADRAYQLARQYIKSDFINWPLLAEGDQRLKKKITQLSTTQRRIYHEFIDEYHNFYDNHCIPAGGGDQPDKLYIWNWPTWHRVIIKVAGSITGDPGPDDCYFCDFSGDAQHRPKLSVRPGVIEKRPDGNFSRVNIFDYYADESSPDARTETMAARIMCVLHNGLPSDERLQASHRCHNNPELCIKPIHVVWESDKVNKSRNLCVHGSFLHCRHRIKCIWTSLAGRFLPHRNMDYLHVDCDCDEDCHTAEVMEVEALDDE